MEAGDLPVKDWKGDALKPTTWKELRDLAVYIAVPNPDLGDNNVPYSKKHYQNVCARFGDPKENFGKYKTIFIDSISQASRMSLPLL
ncbi:AAA family ATPase [Candidatus Liberibacter africanus]|uniref:Uncharacterized protein n=1 Tax=Candidatus Liberibacter africanus PTSAPSY TaxID=1277257 RepID=A0A0G3I3P9_LIBAF|nr:hypothetical protein G293_04300 [Candidatus Liberibacter africanus PTSAPSY]QTP64195.1 AAA family ATPase [Candidatus Liberibacter africanus]